MRAHIIVDGGVINTIMASVAEAQKAYPGATCIDGETGAIGWTLVDGALFAPVVVTDPNAPILSTIASLEATVSPRRIREAVTTDAGKTWMTAIDTQIANLRKTLVK